MLKANVYGEIFSLQGIFDYGNIVIDALTLRSILLLGGGALISRSEVKHFSVAVTWYPVRTADKKQDFIGCFSFEKSSLHVSVMILVKCSE